MVSVKKRTIKGKTYYYLSHTYREGGKVKYRETYLGNEIPADIEKMKNKFTQRIYKEKWFGTFEKIKSRYSKELYKAPQEALDKNMEAFMVAFTYDTNRIEGSRLSLKDAAMLLGQGTTPKDKPVSDIKEAEAHKKVFYEMLDYNRDLSIDVVLKWHGELFGETKPELAGKLRDYQVYIRGTRFIPPTPTDVPSRMHGFFAWYNREKDTMNHVELAALVHVKFESIHPFGDGNGRVGRLIMNFILHRSGYPMLNIPYTNRMDYYNAIERAQVKKDDSVFVAWFFKRYVKECAIYLR